MKTIWFVAFAALLTAASPPAAAAADVHIVIEGIRSANGSILVGLYASKESFDRAIELADKQSFANDPGRTAGAAFQANDSLKAGITFMGIKPGRYAIIVVDDENGNGILDKNFFGVPTEPYGFSNKAEGMLGPPSFAEAAVTINGDTTIIIDLIYHGTGKLAEP